MPQIGAMLDVTSEEEKGGPFEIVAGNRVLHEQVDPDDPRRQRSAARVVR